MLKNSVTNGAHNQEFEYYHCREPLKVFEHGNDM